MKNFWVSWYQSSTPFTLESPWWVTGSRFITSRLAFDEEKEQDTICAAVQAADRQGATDVIIAAHDTPPRDLEWRFIEERPTGWSPFCDRFPRGDWMKWPAAAPTSSQEK